MTLPHIFILYDMEYTAWKGSRKRNWGHNWEEREIIQISAFKIQKEKAEKSFTIKDTFNVYIKPTKNPILSNYITNLTGITNKIIKKHAINIKDGLLRFYDFCSSDKGLYHMYSYGNDYKVIKENLILNKIHKNSKLYKMGNKMHDIKRILKKHGVDTDKYSSGEVYKHFNIKVKNPNVHNSFWDIKSQFLVLNYLIHNNYNI